MKVDIYTKSILTLIAICLSIIALKQLDLVPKAFANDMVKPELPYTLVPLNADGSIDVNITSNSSTLDVNISEITTNQELEVELEEVDTYAFTYCTVPVDVQ